MSAHRFLFFPVFYFITFFTPSCLHAQFVDGSGYYVPVVTKDKVEHLPLKSMVLEFISHKEVIMIAGYDNGDEKTDTVSLRRDEVAYFTFISDSLKMELTVKAGSDIIHLSKKDGSMKTTFRVFYPDTFPENMIHSGHDIKELKTYMLNDSMLCFSLSMSLTGVGEGNLNGIAFKTEDGDFIYYDYPMNDPDVRKKNIKWTKRYCSVRFIKKGRGYVVKEEDCDVYHTTDVLFNGVYKK